MYASLGSSFTLPSCALSFLSVKLKYITICHKSSIYSTLAQVKLTSYNTAVLRKAGEIYLRRKRSFVVADCRAIKRRNCHPEAHGSPGEYGNKHEFFTHPFPNVRVVRLTGPPPNVYKKGVRASFGPPFCRRGELTTRFFAGTTIDV